MVQIELTEEEISALKKQGIDMNELIKSKKDVIFTVKDDVENEEQPVTEKYRGILESLSEKNRLITKILEKRYVCNPWGKKDFTYAVNDDRTWLSLSDRYDFVDVINSLFRGCYRLDDTVSFIKVEDFSKNEFTYDSVNKVMKSVTDVRSNAEMINYVIDKHFNIKFGRNVNHKDDNIKSGMTSFIERFPRNIKRMNNTDFLNEQKELLEFYTKAYNDLLSCDPEKKLKGSVKVLNASFVTDNDKERNEVAKDRTQAIIEKLKHNIEYLIEQTTYNGKEIICIQRISKETEPKDVVDVTEEMFSRLRNKPVDNVDNASYEAYVSYAKSLEEKCRVVYGISDKIKENNK
jgi:hypothetical protein